MAHTPPVSRVLMIPWEYPPFYTGGAGVACAGMVRGLLQRGTEVHIVLPWLGKILRPKPSGDLPEIPGYTASTGPDIAGVYGIDMETPSPVFVVPEINITFNLIHCHDWPTVPTALELKKRLGAPLVFHLHSLQSDREPTGGIRKIGELEQEGCRRADMVITVSKHTAGKVVSEYGVSSEKVRVLYNGHTLGNCPRTKRNYGTGNRRVLFLGRLVPQKGPDIFLKAAAILAEARNDVTFVIAGTGPMARKLREQLAGRIIFTGAVPRDEISVLLDTSDILVMPSRAEPFGIAALEAMSRGCVVIITRTAGLTEIAKNVVSLEGENPVELAHLISDLLDDPERMEAISRMTEEEASALNWEMRIPALLGFYDELR